MCSVGNNTKDWSSTFYDAGNKMDDARRALLEEASKDEPNSGKLAELQHQFDKQNQVFAMLQELWKSVNQNIMRIIQNINPR